MQRIARRAPDRSREAMTSNAGSGAAAPGGLRHPGHVVKPRDGEVELEDRVVRNPLGAGTEVREMPDEERLEVEPQVVEPRPVQRDEVGGLGGALREAARGFRHDPPDAPGGFGRLPGGPGGERSDPLLEGREGRLREVGRVIATSPVHEVVSLVDEKESGAERRRVPRSGEGDHRIEDVVVVSDDDVGALGQLQGDLEGTDVLPPGLLEDVARLEVAPGIEKPLDETGRLHLGRVVLREAAVVFVAEDDVVRAHPLLRPEAD